MTLDEQELADRIGEAIRWEGKDGTWADVTERAWRHSHACRLDSTNEPKRVRLPSRGRSMLIAAALVLVGGSIAFALANRLVDALNPPPLRPTPEQLLKDYSRPFQTPTVGGPPSLRKAQVGKVIPGTVRLLIRLETHRFGLVLLYGARAQHGVCFVIVRDDNSSGQCSSNLVPTNSPVVFGYDTSSEKPGSDVVDGHAVSRKARALRIRFRHGSSRVVPITARFFLFELGPAHSGRSSDPAVAFDVLDAAGHTIGTRSDPFRLEKVSASAARPVASTIRLRAHQTLPYGGGVVTISSGRSTNGDSCFQVLLRGRNPVAPATTWVCNPGIRRYGLKLDDKNPRIIHRVPVSWTLGRSESTSVSSHTYAFGWAAPKISRLRIHFQDGTTASIPLHDGYFLYAIPPANWLAGHRPSILRAYGSTGALAYEQFLYPRQSCVYPGLGSGCGTSNGGAASGQSMPGDG